MLICHDGEMSSTDQPSPDGAKLVVRLNGRSFVRNLLFLVLLFLAYLALAIFSSGIWRLLGVAGTVVFGVTGLTAGLAGIRQIRTRPVVATLDAAGVTFDRHAPAAWEEFLEVRLGRVKPRLLFALRPMHYIAFVPSKIHDLPRGTTRQRLGIRMYGTSMVLMTQTVTPTADEILDAVQRLSDVPVRR
jgi:hypothetical protein